jgi:hypothetical protein
VATAKPNLSIEMLSPERAAELWPELEPLFSKAVVGNEIAKEELEPNDIFILTQTGMCVVFVGFESGSPACVLAIQFYMVGNKKGADIIALAGKNLLSFKVAYWESILKWLKANQIKSLDAYVTDRWAKIYQEKFGFNKSCSYVRMNI